MERLTITEIPIKFNNFDKIKEISKEKIKQFLKKKMIIFNLKMKFMTISYKNEEFS